MFGWLSRRRGARLPPDLYASLVAQARAPVLFEEFGFPDTVTGRFDSLALHMFLFSRRLVREDTGTAKGLNQEVFDLFTDDTDRALRELGIGDTSVPKRKKKLIRSFYALVEELAEPLDTDDRAALEARLAARFGDAKMPGGESGATAALADYVTAAVAALDSQPADALYDGRLDWPDPASCLPVDARQPAAPEGGM